MVLAVVYSWIRELSMGSNGFCFRDNIIGYAICSSWPGLFGVSCLYGPLGDFKDGKVTNLKTR